MRDALSELDLRLPSMRRVGLLAVVALKVLDHELHLERLLQQSVRLHFFLHSQFDLDSS